MSWFNKTAPTVRRNLFEDETSEIGKARIAKYHRRMDAVVDELKKEHLRLFPDLVPPKGSGQE